jgi:hypothetical protein
MNKNLATLAGNCNHRRFILERRVGRREETVAALLGNGQRRETAASVPRSPQTSPNP